MDNNVFTHIEAEQSIIGAIILDNDALCRVAEILTPEDFHDPKAQTIYTACLALLDNGAPLDLMTITDKLKEMGTLDAAGGPAGVSHYAGTVSTALNCRHWAELVRKRSVARRIAREGNKMLREVHEGGDPFEIAQRYSIALAEIDALTLYNEVEPLEAVVAQAWDEIEAAHAGRGSAGIQTPFSWLNEKFEFRKAELTLLAGRPSMGKSAMALRCGLWAAAKGCKSLFSSLEVTNVAIARRALAMVSGVNGNRLRTGRIDDIEWKPLVREAERIIAAGYPFWMDESVLTLQGLINRARRIKRQRGLDFMIVDYLQLIIHRGRSREEEVGEISRSLKALAKELDIPILALSQFNREPESQGVEDMPSEAALRESGSLEQDANNIILIKLPYRHARNKGEPEDGSRQRRPFWFNWAIIKLAKQREGPTGQCSLWWNEETTKFEDWPADKAVPCDANYKELK